MADRVVDTLKQGQHIGECLLLGIDDHWDCDLQAATALGCTICDISREIFWELVVQHARENRIFESLVEKNKACKKDGTLKYKCQIFDGLSEHALHALDAHLIRRLYFPGEMLLKEGEEGNAVYILVNGFARIEIVGRLVRMEGRHANKERACSRSSSQNSVHTQATHATNFGKKSSHGRKSMSRSASRMSRSLSRSFSRHDMDELEDLKEPICFGELGLLGLQEINTASVCVDSHCHVRILHRSFFLEILDKHNESIEATGMMRVVRKGSLTKSSREMIMKVPCFQEVGCSSEFLDFLASHLEDRIYLTGQQVIVEGSEERCMYLINQGKTEVYKHGIQIAVRKAGDVVGELTALGVAMKRTADVIASETCYMSVLHQGVVFSGLEMFPQERSKMLTLAIKSQQASGMTQEDGGLHAFSSERSMTDEEQQEAIVEALRASPVFGDTDPEFLEQLSSIATYHIYMPGEPIIEKGTAGDFLYVVIAGSAAIYKRQG